MILHIGKKIKEALRHQNISVTDFAKRITKSRNVIYNIFERESLDTALLYQISLALNTDFFSLYSAQNVLSTKDVKSFRYNHLLGNPYAAQLATIKILSANQEKEIAYLKKIISLLENPTVK